MSVCIGVGGMKMCATAKLSVSLRRVCMYMNVCNGVGGMKNCVTAKLSVSLRRVCVYMNGCQGGWNESVCDS